MSAPRASRLPVDTPPRVVVTAFAPTAPGLTRGLARPLPKPAPDAPAPPVAQ